MSLSDAITNGVNIAIGLRQQRLREQSARLDESYRRDMLAHRRNVEGRDISLRENVFEFTRQKDARDFRENVRQADRTAAQEDERIGISRRLASVQEGRLAFDEDKERYQRGELLAGQVAALHMDGLINGDPVTGLNKALALAYNDPEYRAKEGEDIAGDPNYFGMTSDKSRPLTPVVGPAGKAVYAGKNAKGEVQALTERRGAGSQNPNDPIVEVPAEQPISRIMADLSKSPTAIAQYRAGLAALRYMNPNELEKLSDEDVIRAVGEVTADRVRQQEQSAASAPAASAPPLDQPAAADGTPWNVPPGGRTAHAFGTTVQGAVDALPGLADRAGQAIYTTITGQAPRGAERVSHGTSGSWAPAASTPAPGPAASPAEAATGTNAPAGLAAPPAGMSPDEVAARRQAVRDYRNLTALGLDVSADQFGSIQATGNPNDAFFEQHLAATAADQKALQAQRDKATATMSAAIELVTRGNKYLEGQRGQMGSDMTHMYDISGGRFADPQMARAGADALRSLLNFEDMQEPEAQPWRVGAALGSVNAGIDVRNPELVERATRRAQNFADSVETPLSESHIPLLVELYAGGYTPEQVAQLQAILADPDMTGAVARRAVAGGGLRALPAVLGR